MNFRVTKEQIKELYELQPHLKKTKRYKRSLAYRETNYNHVQKMLELFGLLVDDFHLKDIDHDKVIALILAHDLGEIGMKFDIGCYEHRNNEEISKEKSRQENITMMDLASKHGIFLLNLCDEYKEQKTRESQLVKALDRLDAQIRILGVKGIKHEPTQDRADFAMRNLLSVAEIFPEIAQLVEQILEQAKDDASFKDHKFLCFTKKAKFKWNPEWKIPNLEKDTATPPALNARE